VAANTIIQILRSYFNTTPPTLGDGEMAYSFVSNTHYIGDTNGGTHRIGGEYYTQKIEAATRNLTANTLVLRDANSSINVVVEFVDGGAF